MTDDAKTPETPETPSAPEAAAEAKKPKEPKQPKGDKGKGGKGEKGGKKPEAAPEPEGPPAEPAPRARLLDYYEQRVRAKLQQQFAFKNPHQIPRLLKIVLNVGMGDASKNAKGLDAAVAELG